MFQRVLGGIKKRTVEKLGDIPTLIGEFGIPYDMHAKKAYETGQFDRQELALDRSFQALEANLLHATLWNYTPDNSNEHGDLWNEEDLSIFSRDQQTNPMDINSGARAHQPPSSGLIRWRRPGNRCLFPSICAASTSNSTSRGTRK